MERLKTLWRVIMVFSVSLLMLGLVHMVGGQSQPATSLTVEALSKYGSQGSEVRQIQTKLKNWGYYFGQVDGIYGSETQEAVRFFQRKNKLQVDGIAGPKTLEAMGIMGQGNTGGNGQYSQSDFNLLARMISAEARGEP